MIERDRLMAATEPLHDVAHLGGVELFTPLPDPSLWYFRDLLGMEVVHNAGPSVYLRGYGDHGNGLRVLRADRTALKCRCS